MKATAVMPEPIKQGEILKEPSPETGIIPQKTSSEAEKTSKETSSDELFPETGNSPKEQSLLQDIIALAMKLLRDHTYREVTEMTGISKATLARYRRRNT